MQKKTERLGSVEAGTVVVGTDSVTIAEKAQRLLDSPAEYAKIMVTENPFGDGHTAERIAEVLTAQGQL